MRAKPVVRPAVASDFSKFNAKLPYRVRATTGLLDGEVVAVGGIAYLPDGTHGAFFLADEKARTYPVALHKTALQVLQNAKELGIKKLVALADPKIGAAERWLARLGFEPVTLEDQVFWIWHSSSD